MPSNEQPKTRVLVVDDVRDSADVYAALIGRWGYETRAVYDGASCLELTKTFQPQIILLDVGLPGLDGYSVTETLRANPETAAIKIFAVSGYSNPEHLQRCREAGFDDCFTKPVGNEWLKSFLADISRSLKATT